MSELEFSESHACVESWSERHGHQKHMNFVSPSGDFVDIRTNVSDQGKIYYTLTIDNSITANSSQAFSSILLSEKDFHRLRNVLDLFA